MKGLDEFLTLFGDVTLSEVVIFLMAIGFVIFVFGQVKKYFNTKVQIQNERAQAEKQRDEELQEALTAVRKYPEYRQQSIKIQELLEGEIQELRDMIQEDKDRLQRIEEQERRRERNKLRDMLLQNYRYYTDKERNPSQSWTRMESEAFWELFKDYEELDGDGHMHTVVQPAMMSLNVVDITI